MSLTRSLLESILIRRCGQWLSLAGLDGATVSGANLDLNDPLGYALRQVGLPVTDPANVVDGDFSALSNSDLDKLLDLAEYRALQTILENYAAVSLEVGGRSERYSEFADRLQSLLILKYEHLQRDYGLGQGVLQAGVLALDFAQHSDEASSTVLPS